MLCNLFKLKQELWVSILKLLDYMMFNQFYSAVLIKKVFCFLHILKNRFSTTKVNRTIISNNKMQIKSKKGLYLL